MASNNPMSHIDYEHYLAESERTWPPWSGFNVGTSLGAATTSGIKCEQYGVYAVRSDYPVYILPGQTGVFASTINVVDSGFLIDGYETKIVQLEGDHTELGVRPKDAVQARVQYKKVGRFKV